MRVKLIWALVVLMVLLAKYYALLLARVGALVKAGKSLSEIQKEVKMPEYDHWASQERFPTNVEAAYRAVQGK